MFDANPITTQAGAPTIGLWQRARTTDAARVLALWFGIRAGIGLWMLGTSWASGVDAGQRSSDPVGWVIDRLVKWDSDYFVSIAQRG